MVRLGEKEQDISKDEITKYEVGRYISASEAFWRIYDFPIQKKYPPVEQLAIHLEGEQMITFNNDGEAQAVIDSGPPETTLTAFFTAMRENEDKRHITYPNVFKRFVYDISTRRFNRRINKVSKRHSKEMSDTIGRIPVLAFSPHNAELYFLRMLLYRVQGPTCYEDLRIVNGEKHETYAAACIARGICEDHTEVDKILHKSASITFGPKLREVFGNILMFVLQQGHLEFWERHKELISEDVRRHADLEDTDENIHNRVLLEIQEHVERNGYDLTAHFLIPKPERRKQRYTPDIIHETPEPRMAL